MIKTRSFLAALVLLGGVAAITPAQAAAVRHYDCSKPGNARLTLCKSAAAKAAPRAGFTGTARPAAPAALKTPAARPRAVVARPAGAPRAGTTAWTTKSGRVYHYDCGKRGNVAKQACRR